MLSKFRQTQKMISGQQTGLNGYHPSTATAVGQGSSMTAADQQLAQALQSAYGISYGVPAFTSQGDLVNFSYQPGQHRKYL